MLTVSPAEARESLPELLKQIAYEPVLIREGEQDVAMLISASTFDDTMRRLNVTRFEKIRAEAAEELRANLAKEGISVEGFLEDLLKE